MKVIHAIRIGLLASFFLVSVCSTGQSLTVGLTATPQTINLGKYGDKSITQLNIVCTTSASKYRWEVDGPWATASGQTGIFTTTTNEIILYLNPGYYGCAGGTTVSVTNSTGGGGGVLRTSKGSGGEENLVQTFSYIAGFTQPAPYITVTTSPTDPEREIICSLASNTYASTVSYSAWQLTLNSFHSNSTPQLNPSNAVSFMVNNANQPAKLTFYDMITDYTYKGTLQTTVYVSGTPNCTAFATRILNYDFTVEPAQVPPPGGYVTQCDMDSGSGEITCRSFWQSRQQETLAIKVYPNPTSHIVKVQFKSDKNTGASARLFNSTGEVVGSINNLNEEDTFDTSSLPSGIYYICVKGGDKTKTERIIINK